MGIETCADFVKCKRIEPTQPVACVVVRGLLNFADFEGHVSVNILYGI